MRPQFGLQISFQLVGPVCVYLCQQASVLASDVATAALSVLALPVSRLRSVQCTPPMMTDLGLFD